MKAHVIELCSKEPMAMQKYALLTNTNPSPGLGLFPVQSMIQSKSLKQGLDWRINGLNVPSLDKLGIDTR